MKLTKIQRHTFYIIMLSQLEIDTSKNNLGFCHTLVDEIMSVGFGFKHPMYIYSGNVFKSLLPELYTKKPKNDAMHWFPLDKIGYKKRIELLNQCIYETY